MPVRSAVFWRALALVASTGCAFAIGRATRGASPGTAAPARAPAAEPASLFSQWLAVGESPVRRPGLAPLMARVEAARTPQAQCRALARLAASTELDEAALALLRSFTASQRPYEVRVCATNALGTASHPGAPPALAALADDPNLGFLALQELGCSEDPSARPLLLELAREGRGGPSSRRLLAVSALAACGAAEAMDAILAMLATAGANERPGLIAALGTSGDPRALVVLTGILASGTRSDQFSAVQALGELGGPDAARSLVALVEGRPQLAGMVVQALARCDDPVARAALVRFADDTANVALADAALQALSNADGDDVRALMRRALGSTSPARLGAAAEYFAVHPDDDALAVLSDIAREGSPRTVYPAISALGRIGGDDARETLFDLASGTGAAGDSALQTLAQMPGGAERAYELAITRVRSGGPQALVALQVLAADARPEATRAIIDLAMGGDVQASPFAVSQLSQRGGPDAARALVYLASAGKTPNVRASALGALAEAGGPAAQGALESALHDTRGAERAQAAIGLAGVAGPKSERALLTASRDAAADPEFAQGVIGALAQVGTPAAITRLEELASQASPQTSVSALQALASNAPERAAPVAEALARASDPGVRIGALVSVGMLPEPAGRRIVLGALRDSDPSVVRQALDFAATVGTADGAGQRALRDLVESASTPDDVRERAKAMLEGMPPVTEASAVL